jgi:hypothetical protein
MLSNIKGIKGGKIYFKGPFNKIKKINNFLIIREGNITLILINAFLKIALFALKTLYKAYSSSLYSREKLHYYYYFILLALNLSLK